MKSATELRAIAAARRESEAALRATAHLREQERVAFEDSKEMAAILPKLVAEIEEEIEDAANRGMLVTRFSPRALMGYRDTHENRNRYHPILKAACEAVMKAEPELDVRWTDHTGMEWGSDGGYSDGQCAVEITTNLRTA
jgi:hypothetical protein